MNFNNNELRLSDNCKERPEKKPAKKINSNANRELPFKGRKKGNERETEQKIS